MNFDKVASGMPLEIVNLFGNTCPLPCGHTTCLGTIFMYDDRVAGVLLKVAFHVVRHHGLIVEDHISCDRSVDFTNTKIL